MDERGKLEVFAREIEAWNEGDLDLVMAELLPSWISLCMSRKNASDLPAGRILIATFTVWSVARALERRTSASTRKPRPSCPRCSA